MRSAISSSRSPEPRDLARLFEQLERSSLWLDAQYKIPYTRIYIGWDPVIGMIPIAGDLACAALSARNIHWAYRLGARRQVLGRMAVNAAIDALVGAVPVVGTLFDLWYRAHMRNLRLLVQVLQAQRAEDNGSS